MIPLSSLALAASEPVAYDAVSGGMAQVGWLMIALPLLGAALLLVGGRAGRVVHRQPVPLRRPQPG